MIQIETKCEFCNKKQMCYIYDFNKAVCTDCLREMDDKV